MSFIEILENKETRELVNAIEDLESSMAGKNDETLSRMHAAAVSDLYEMTGFRWA